MRILLTILSFLASLASMVHAAPLDEKLRQAFAAGDLPGLHGAIVDFRGTRLIESYFPGEDERWGSPLGMRQHGPDTLHDLRSVTKSVVGLLYGIALAEGKVPPPEAPLYAQFPQYPDLMADEARAGILVGHVLSMQMGLEWNEDLPYSDPRNSEIAMEAAPDRYRYVLEQPVIAPPGGSWIYSGGAVALLGKLIADGTGMSLDDYAQDKLFAPLGIAEFDWIAGADGVPSAASGLRLTLPDLVKIGQMVADGGVWEGRRIVSADWLERAFQPRVRVNEFMQYGYLWYLSGEGTQIAVSGLGNGGQRLTVQADPGYVMAAVSGRYNAPDAWKAPLSVLVDFAIPEIRARMRN